MWRTHISRTTLSLSLLLLCTVICFTSSAVAASSAFNETLLVRPLHNGKLMLHWEFETSESGSGGRHFTLFPKALGEVLYEFNVHSLSLSLSSGRWMTEEHGYETFAPDQPQHTKSNLTTPQRLTRLPVPQHAPHGAELWAVLQPEDSITPAGEGNLPGLVASKPEVSSGPESIERRWRALQAALSGLFCASLGQMKAAATSVPIELFSSLSQPLDPETFRYATLPREVVCTENLAPFVKMLPCRAKRGLAAGLEPKRLYGAQYHSIQVRVKPIFDSTGSGRIDGWTLSQSVTILIDPVVGQGLQSWTLSQLLGVRGGSPTAPGVLCACPLSQHAAVHLHLPAAFSASAVDAGAKSVTVTPEPHLTTLYNTGDKVLSYDLKRIQRPSDAIPSDSCPREQLDLAFEHDSSNRLSLPERSRPVRVERYLSASTLKAGVLYTHISNPSLVRSMRVQFFDSLPWFCGVRWSTMRLSMDGRPMEASDFIAHRYTPATFRASPAQWFFDFVLPGNSTVSLEVSFDKSMLLANDYPPDVSRGFDIGSAIVRVRPVEADSISSGSLTSFEDGWTRFFTEPLVVLLPFPDFSMPFNVIAFTSTILAFFFGSVFNMTYSSTEEILKRKPAYEPTPSLVEKIKAALCRKKKPLEKTA